MTRWWNEQVAAVGDLIGLGPASLVLLLAAALVAAGWYRYPDWLPRNWPTRSPRRADDGESLAAARRSWRDRLRSAALWSAKLWSAKLWSPANWHLLTRLRRAWRRLRTRPQREPSPRTADTDPAAWDTALPDLPVVTFTALADRLAAQGRYADAVRERLRGIVRELVDKGVVAHHPGWTVLELSRAASTARPPVRPPLDAAAKVFSDVWYGLRPAHAEHDELMRGYAGQVREALNPAPDGSAR